MFCNKQDWSLDADGFVCYVVTITTTLIMIMIRFTLVLVIFVVDVSTLEFNLRMFLVGRIFVDCLLACVNPKL